MTAAFIALTFASLMTIPIAAAQTRATATDPAITYCRDAIASGNVGAAERCFATKVEFEKWRACVAAGSNPLKCSLPRVSPPPSDAPYALVLPASANHAQFKFAVFAPDQINLNAITSYDALKRKALTAPVCSFSAAVDNRQHATIRDDTTSNNPSIFTLKLDYQGTSSGPVAACVGASSWLYVKFVGVNANSAITQPVRVDNSSGEWLVDNDTASRDAYRPSYSTYGGTTGPWTAQTAYFAHFELPPATPSAGNPRDAAGAFAFVAVNDFDGRVMLVYDGSFRSLITE